MDVYLHIYIYMHTHIYIYIVGPKMDVPNHSKWSPFEETEPNFSELSARLKVFSCKVVSRFGLGRWRREVWGWVVM